LALWRKQLVIGFLLVLSSCSVGPDYVPPCVETPSHWKNKSCTNAADPYLDFWWEVFYDEKLNELEALALENNRDLFIAYERIQESRALMGIAAADFYPQITLNPLYTSTGELIKNYANSSLVSVPLTPFRAHELLYFLPVNVSYEVDLWGKIQDQYRAAKYSWFAQKEDFDAVLLTLTSNLAFAYFQLRTADKQIELLQQVLKTRQKAYQINLDRYEGRIIFYADVALAAEEVGNVLIEYEETLRQRKIMEDQLAVLIGIPASEFCLDPIPLLEIPPPCIPAGLPSEVLLRRPDIAEAEYRTRSAHQLVKQAYAEFFPSLTLTAVGGFESPILRDFLRWISRYWMLGVGSDQLIFDGFRTPYYLQQQLARFYEASGQYQQQVLIAFQEVEDALTNIDLYAKEHNNSEIVTKWAEKAYQLYSDRYQLGLINYIDVVNTERDLLNSQIQVNALHGYQYMATVQLIKALGGGWSLP